ncbi:hypothetical protein XELAEV_18025208mg [Xenopus laevis]|uniref:Kinesin-like protein n=1 Tax=Xenopus laevis TaxID=8355 RepID=A0A974D0C1_XENLA|nr:hypothetical protein XELAEV_18025208mg [Xenopus laevis]
MERLVATRLVTGLAVKIMRSNGVIHNANITSVNMDRSSVNVEWKEGEANKGKEISFADVISVNPELLDAVLAPTNVKENMPPQRNVSSQNHKRKTISKIPAPKEVAAKNSLLSESGAQSVLRERSTRMTAIHETLPYENEMEAESTPLPIQQNSVQARSRSTKVSIAEEPRLQTRISEIVEESLPSGRNNQGRRKSNIVKEMEKMKNKREEQRAQNYERRMKRAQDYDTSVPNWEFGKMIKEFRATMDCHRISMADPAEEHRICVCVRKRPLNKQELSKKEIDIISVPSKNIVLVHEPKLKVDLTKYLENQAFRFDFSFDETATNEVVYRFTARPLVQSIFEGGKATCFAYGQTGSGKTHTMGGDFSGKSQNVSKGVYAFASRDVFLLLDQPRYKHLDLDVFVTFFEIYNGKVFDLLNKKTKLRVLEDAKQEVQVVGLLEKQVISADDVFKMIEIGSACRTSGQTFANTSSSRSHACLQIILRRGSKLHGKFSLVDLAGNERGVDTASADRITRMEGAEINRSLLALKIAMLSPGFNSCEYTLNTLRYADRVKELSPQNAETNDDNLQMEDSGGSHASIEGLQLQDDFLLKDEELSTHNSFQDALNRVGELEDKAVDELRELVQKEPEWTNLLQMTEQPDYDLENFVMQAEYLIQERSKVLIALGDSINSLRLALQVEEQASKQISKKKRSNK